MFRIAIRALTALLIAVSLAGCSGTHGVMGDGSTTSPIILSDITDSLPVGLHMDVLEDPTGTLTIDDVSSPAYAAQFRPTPVANPNFGFPAGTVWLRIPIRNAAATPTTWIIGSPDDTVDRMTFYQPDGAGGYSALVAGYAIPFDDWPIRALGALGPHFPLQLAPGDEAVVYFSLRNQGRINAALHIETEEAMGRADESSLLAIALVAGGLAILALFNLLLGMWQRDRDHLLLAAFVGTTLVRVAIWMGDRLLWPAVAGRFDIIGPVTIALYALCFLLFTVHLLDTRHTAPRFHRALLGMAAAFGLTFVVALAGDRRLVTMAQFLLLPATFGLTSLMALRLWRRGNRDGLLFLLATLPLLVFVSLETIPSFRFPFAAAVGSGLSGLGIALTALFLSVTLAARVGRWWRVTEANRADLQRANTRLDEANRRLDEERARFATILDDQVEALGRVSQDGTIYFVNQAFCEFYDRPRETLIGSSIFDLMSPETREYVKRQLAMLTPEQPFVVVEAQVPNVQGELRWRRATVRAFFDAQNNLQEMQFTTVDTTDAHQMDDALRRGRDDLERAHARYGLILNDLTEGIARFRLDGETLFVNQAFCGFYGGTPETRIGANLFETMSPETLYAVQAMIAAISVGAPMAVIERQFPGDDGRLVWRRYAIRGFFDEAGRPVEFQSATIDTSEDRRKDEELRRYRDELEQLVAERTAQLEQANEALDRERRNADSLRQIAYTLNTSLDTRTVFNVILREIRRARPHDSMVRLLLNSEAGIATAAMMTADSDDVTLGDMPAVHDAADTGWAGVQAVLTGETFVVNDLSQWPDWAGQEQFPTLQSVVGVPLRAGSRLLGSLVLASEQLDAYQPEDVAMIQAFADHASLAISNAMRYEQSKQLATIAERERISRDLHDSVTQTLFSASLIAQTLPLQLEHDATAVGHNIDRLTLLTQGALSEMRILLAEMRPLTLTKTDLRTLFGYLASAAASRSSVQVEVIVTGDAGSLPDDVHVAVYRVAQEALNNVVKHSNATTCRVMLHQEADGLILRIVDDGHGFDPAQQGNGTLGMTSMNERAQAVGALLSVTSSHGGGTEVSLVWGRESADAAALVEEPAVPNRLN